MSFPAPVTLLSEVAQYLNVSQIADDTAFNNQSVTFTSAAIAKYRPVIDGVTYNSMEDVPLGPAKEATGILVNEGNDTAFDETFIWQSPRKFLIDKAVYNFCFANNLSAWTDGSRTLANVIMDFDVLSVNNPYPLVGQQNIATGLAAQGATGLSMFIFVHAFRVNKPVDVNDFIRLRLRTSVTGSGTNTRQEGIIPYFPFHQQDATRPFTMAGIYLEGRTVV